MKNRKSLLTISIFALVLVLSVGYAVVSSVELDITGTAEAQAQDLKVSFKSASPNSGDVKGTVTAGSLTASLTANNLTLNNPVTVTYVVENSETDVNALIKEKTITNSNTEYFSVTTNAASGLTCNAKGTTNVTVTVTLIKTPVETADNSANIEIALTASPINNAS